MKTKHKIKLLEIAANCAGTLSTGGKRLSDIRTVYDSLVGMVGNRSENDIRDKPGALVRVEDCKFPTHVLNVLRRYEIKTLGQLAVKSGSEVANWQGCGMAAFDRLRYALSQNGLGFGMTNGQESIPTLRVDRRVRYKTGKSLWVTGFIRSIESDFARLDYDIDGGHTLLFRDYGKKWEVVL